jgi:hypothetical protein
VRCVPACIPGFPSSASVARSAPAPSVPCSTP